MLLASHPRPVRDAIDRHRRGFDDDPVTYFHENVERCERALRESAAAYLGVRADEVAITGNTTTGLAMLYGGLPLARGQEIVTTTHDHYVTHESLRLRALHTGAPFRKVTLYATPETATEDEIVSQPGQGDRPAHARGRGHLGPLVDRREAADPAHGRRAGRPEPAARRGRPRAPVRRRRARLRRRERDHGRPRLRLLRRRLSQVALRPARHRPGLGARRGLERPRRAHPDVRLGRVRALDARRAARIRCRRGRAPRRAVSSRSSTAGRCRRRSRFTSSSAARASPRASTSSRRRCKEGLAAIPSVKLHTPRADALSAGLVCFEVAGKTPKAVVDHLATRKIVASDDALRARRSRAFRPACSTRPKRSTAPSPRCARCSRWLRGSRARRRDQIVPRRLDHQ